ncbi:DUF397 domain-containing protein [Streptomyces sp. SHP 1-2]|uniref:DUF397 domain-containing protein n=1 Tax=Streptomyces sp. SHP 1-2 TaxID=2769489 RepID=UPI00223876C0|nr:DUF397 domain-containing protein [Streptomyces sp. SHP 1-2]MCW5252996.1 DUF397 domain-containing protein [Streptomyces sp. SHP 1-2]
MNGREADRTRWVKSSYSGHNGGDCVEVAPGFSGVVPVRDSKNPDGPVVAMGRDAWRAFIPMLG